MVASFCFGLRQDKLGQEDWVEVTVLEDVASEAEVAMVKLPPPKAPTTTAAPVRLRTAKLCHHRIPTQTFGTCPTTTS